MSTTPFSNDKKTTTKLSTPKKLWKYLFSTFRSKVLNRKPQVTSSKTNPNFMSDMIYTRKNHQHHNHYHTISHHHHYYYHHPPPNLNQNLPPAETSLCVGHKPSDHKSSSGDATSPTMEMELVPQKVDEEGTANSHSIEIEVVSERKSDGEGKHIHTITPEFEFFDATDDDIVEDGPEIMCCDSKYITVCRLPLFGVDAKAEEFINRRKEIWRLERQQSEEEFRDMLARSA